LNGERCAECRSARFSSREILPPIKGRPEGERRLRNLARSYVLASTPIMRIRSLDRKSMTDHDMRAIYEYLSYFPCIEVWPGPAQSASHCHPLPEF
jgi:hypothetical protein